MESKEKKPHHRTAPAAVDGAAQDAPAGWAGQNHITLNPVQRDEVQ